MQNESKDKIKETVRARYGEIAKGPGGCGCSNLTSCCSGETFAPDSYKDVPGYRPEADLGLGCGIPTELAEIEAGDTVVDLGSGAGMDAFIARRIVGENGAVIGVDMTPEMVERARANNLKIGYRNVSFVLGDIESLPLKENLADVVVSNCVFNLLPNKAKGFKEVYRILKSGGHFSISDVVTNQPLPEEIRGAVALYTGCIAGAITRDEYLKIIQEQGFSDVSIRRETNIVVPDEIVAKYVGREAVSWIKKSGLKLLSVSVYGRKP